MIAIHLHPEETDVESLGLKSILNLQRGGDNSEMGWCVGSGVKQFDFDWSGFSIPAMKSIRQVVAIIADKENHPIYFHCRFGRERTGLVAASYRILVEDWPLEKAYDEMVSIGCRAPHRWFYKRILKSLKMEVR